MLQHKAADPTAKIPTKFSEPSLHRHPAVAIEDVAHLLLERRRILRADASLAAAAVVRDDFTEFSIGGANAGAAKYLYGLHGKAALVPWIRSAIGLNIIAALLLLWPGVSAMKRRPLLVADCATAFGNAWTEKGMGFIVPGVIPSTLHEIVDNVPGRLEWKFTVAIWAFGLMVFTIAMKTALPTLRHPAED